MKQNSTLHSLLLSAFSSFSLEGKELKAEVCFLLHQCLISFSHGMLRTYWMLYTSNVCSVFSWYSSGLCPAEDEKEGAAEREELAGTHLTGRVCPGLPEGLSTRPSAWQPHREPPGSHSCCRLAVLEALLASVSYTNNNSCWACSWKQMAPLKSGSGKSKNNLL